MKSTGNHPQKALCSGGYGVESSTTSKDYGASVMTILGKTTEPQMPGSNQQLSYSDKWCSEPAWTPWPYRFNRFLAPLPQHTVVSSELPKGFLKGSLGEEATTASVHSPAFKVQFSSVQSLSHVQPFVAPWTAAHQASLSVTNSQSLLKLVSFESVMPSSHLILCRPLLSSPSIFPSIRVFSNESALHIRWPKYSSFSFSISPSNEQSGLISFRMD